MKKILLALLVFAGSVCAVAAQQVEPETYKAALGRFQESYNKGDYQGIYSDFSATMQAALSEKQYVATSAALKSQLGDLRALQFTEMRQMVAFYRAQFDKATMSLILSLDTELKINGLYFKPYADPAVEAGAKTIPRNTVPMALPLSGEWFVFWGGDTREQNYHVAFPAQKNAIDFLMVGPDGKSYRSDGRTNQDYYAFGQELYAPCGGEVVMAVDGIPDNTPGVMNPAFMTGNCVMIKTPDGIYLLMAHFKQGSVRVKQGDRLKQGDLLGLCGNSGNSSEAHLHMHLQNTENLNASTGVKCYFSALLVDGVPKNDYSPLKGERIKSVSSADPKKQKPLREFPSKPQGISRIQ